MCHRVCHYGVQVSLISVSGKQPTLMVPPPRPRCSTPLSSLPCCWRSGTRPRYTRSIFRAMCTAPSRCSRLRTGFRLRPWSNHPAPPGHPGGGGLGLISWPISAILRGGQPLCRLVYVYKIPPRKVATMARVGRPRLHATATDRTRAYRANKRRAAVAPHALEADWPLYPVSERLAGGGSAVARCCSGHGPWLTHRL